MALYMPDNTAADANKYIVMSVNGKIDEKLIYHVRLHRLKEYATLPSLASYWHTLAGPISLIYHRESRCQRINHRGEAPEYHRSCTTVKMAVQRYNGSTTL